MVKMILNMRDKGKRKPFIVRFLRTFLIVLAVIVLIPFIVAGVSFIGRISPDSVIPDAYRLYARIPNPARLTERLLNHDPLPEILALPEFASFLPQFTRFREKGFPENRWVRIAVRGRLDAAILSEGSLLAAWDAGVLSPLIRVLPFLAGRITVPGLYYVQGGKNSRFEYRMEGGRVFYIGPYRNLLIISDNSGLFESVIAGTSRDGDRRGQDNKAFYAEDFDIGFLLSPDFFKGFLTEADPLVTAALEEFRFSGPVEAVLSVEPKKLGITLAAALSSGNGGLENILARNSGAPTLSRMLSGSAQYATILSAGPLKDIIDAAAAIPGSNLAEPWKKADSSSRSLLGLSIEELLYSWTGTEFALMGLEGRPNPVIIMEVRDEKKRQEVFNKAFKSIVFNENIQLNLDGTRLPRIELPGFLDSLLVSMGIRIPSPYYTIHEGCLFLSESAESLLEAVNSVRKNSGLIRTDLWRTLSESGPAQSSFGIFYSLDRSLPFFLKGSAMVNTILRLYRQGLVRLSLNNRMLGVYLSVIPGSGRGLALLQGYPFSLGGKAGNQVYALPPGRNSEARLLLTKDGAAAAVNPADQSVRELPVPGSLWVIPAEGIEGGVWVVSSQGRVILANADLETLSGFPVITGLRLSAAPAAKGGKLYLSGEDGSVHTVDAKGIQSPWGRAFEWALRSPPSFLDLQNKTYAAFYPKSFLGELWVMDSDGAPLIGWPVPASGIAFGSPLLFAYQDRPCAAFITQAGELTVYYENGALFQAFPRELEGVFYLQPVFDGEYLWIISAEGVLYQVSLEGNVLFQEIPNLEVRESGFIAAVDTDGDKRPEIFISGEGNALYGYSRNFSSLEGFPLPVWGRPAFADLNGDGKIECAGAGMDNRIYRWQFRQEEP
jgi:outer membrane protein assembly factor BamB